MKEKKVQNLEEKNQPEQVTVKQGKRWRKVSVLTLVCVMALSVSAFAENTSGMANVLAQSSNVTSLLNTAFDLITGNALLATFCLIGLVGASLRLFRRGKRAAR